MIVPIILEKAVNRAIIFVAEVCWMDFEDWRDSQNRWQEECQNWKGKLYHQSSKWYQRYSKDFSNQDGADFSQPAELLIKIRNFILVYSFQVDLRDKRRVQANLSTWIEKHSENLRRQKSFSNYCLAFHFWLIAMMELFWLIKFLPRSISISSPLC